MKFVRPLIITAAFGVLAVAVATRLNPSFMILAAPGVRLRSPFCTVWKASLDGRIKLQQQAATAEIAKASHLVRRDGELALWSTPTGEFWIPNGNDELLPLLLAQEQRNIYGEGEWGVQQGDVVVDVGAYIGTWTKQALARGAKQVVAIEPTPTSVECLRRNLASEIRAGKVVVYPKGIWDSEGTLTLFANSKDGVGNSFVETNEATKNIDQIPVTTIDRVTAELNLARVNFIKADVKGATQRLLRGAAGVIHRDRPRIALSTEEAEDDALAIERVAHQIQPGYRLKCGPCLTDQKEIYTDVLFFR